MPEISIGAALIHVTGVVACGQKSIVATSPVPYGTLTPKSMEFVYLIIELGLELGLDNYTIFGCGCHKELFPQAFFLCNVNNM